mmetsp:Transcript_47989/g.63526  ORF Transcript_47989/g.63526 Transcript_47989/m.63526 type:complete len:98 (-) Transcript_47989:637-930(-)
MAGAPQPQAVSEPAIALADPLIALLLVDTPLQAVGQSEHFLRVVQVAARGARRLELASTAHHQVQEGIDAELLGLEHRDYVVDYQKIDQFIAPHLDL